MTGIGRIGLSHGASPVAGMVIARKVPVLAGALDGTSLTVVRDGDRLTSGGLPQAVITSTRAAMSAPTPRGSGDRKGTSAEA